MLCVVNFLIVLLSNPRVRNREGNGTPLQYSCLENPMDGGAWQAAVHEVAKSRTRLSDFTFMHWRRKWQPTPVFLPGESQGRGSLVGCCLWCRTELDTTEVTQQQQQLLQVLHQRHKVLGQRWHGGRQRIFLLENLLNLLYSTGNYAQYFVRVYICITGILCAPETNTTL